MDSIVGIWPLLIAGASIGGVIILSLMSDWSSKDWNESSAEISRQRITQWDTES